MPRRENDHGDDRLSRPRVAAIAKFMIAMQRQLWRQRRTASPEFVVLTGASSVVSHRCLELAQEGRMDDAAVQELRRLARHHRFALSDALKSCTQSGMHLESRTANRQARLLRAAITDQPVAPEIPAEMDHIKALERLLWLPQEQAFQELAERDPRLLDLLDQVQQWPVRPWESRNTDRETLRALRNLLELLTPGGHYRQADDPILSSGVAWAVVHGFLASIAFPGYPSRPTRRPPQGGIQN